MASESYTGRARSWSRRSNRAVYQWRGALARSIGFERAASAGDFSFRRNDVSRTSDACRPVVGLQTNSGCSAFLSAVIHTYACCSFTVLAQLCIGVLRRRIAEAVGLQTNSGD